MAQPISRRTLLRHAGLTGAAVAGAVAGYSVLGDRSAAVRPTAGSLDSLGSADPGSLAELGDVWRFVSRPDLVPARLTVTGQAGDDGGYVLCAPRNFVGQPVVGQSGLLIADQQGAPVWFRPLDNPFDLQVATYQGETVLLWWHGSIAHGHGAGSVTITDTAYNTIAEVHTVGDVGADLHECFITDAGTLLVTVYVPVHADLSSVGGPSDGWVYEGRIQEIDIATGERTMQWNSLEGVPVEESTLDVGGSGSADDPFDYFHINSIQPVGGGLIVSARHTDAVYKIARDGSSVLWRMGGTNSDFTVDADAGFARQHHARLRPDGTLSLFDNEAQGGVSSGLLLNVDWNDKKVHVQKRFLHPDGLWANSQGSTQILADGGAFVGWGAAHRMSRFSADGTMVWDAEFPGGDHTYRGFLQQWEGSPDDSPVAAAVPALGGVDVYASWNGATEVHSWRLLTGGRPDALRPVGDVPRTGFETKAHHGGYEAWYAMAALDAAGSELGRSEPVRLLG